MGIINRFTEIMKSNINALLDKAENPSKMIDQTLRNLREDLAEVKTDTAAVMANEKRDKRALEEGEAEVARLSKAAMNALKSGNEEDARKLVASKQKAEARLESLRRNYESSSANAAKMRQMHDKLVEDIKELESRRDSIKATISNAKAQEKVNKITGASGSGTASSIEAFERAEQRAQEMLDQAEAKADLNDHSASNEIEELANKYAGSATDPSVDDEIERMKKELQSMQ